MDKARKMSQLAVEALREKKGKDIKVIDISEISVVADYFIIATGNSSIQVNGLVDHVEEVLHKAGYPLRAREGYRTGSWVLLDFSDIIVHVFDKENRLFYDLERIWKDGRDVDVDILLAEK